MKDIETMLNKTNRKLIVASEKLFISNSLLKEFMKDHDILTFNYDTSIDLEENSREVWKKFIMNLDYSYDKIVFMGHGVDCNIIYPLYRNKKLDFDAAVFVDYKNPDTLLIPPSYEEALRKSKVKIYSFSTRNKKETPSAIIQSHQSLPWYHTTRSYRLAQEIYGCIVYDTYQENYLSGANSKLI